MAQSDLAQLMRGLLYPNSEIIFAAQSEDPEVAAAAAAANLGPFGTKIRYAGWEGVENASLMLSEAASPIMLPGRLCGNGLPVPLSDDDFRQYAAGLVKAGQAAYAAARVRDLDAMLDVSGVVSDACAACHDVYRDKPDDTMRCVRD